MAFAKGVMELEIRILTGGDADSYACRVVRDLHDCSGVENGRLSTHAASQGEKGIIEDLGVVAVTILNASGAEALMTILRSVLPRRREMAPDGKVIDITGRDGFHLRIEGGMSDKEFSLVLAKLLSKIR
jgi:hypothetical protein